MKKKVKLCEFSIIFDYPHQTSTGIHDGIEWYMWSVTVRFSFNHEYFHWNGTRVGKLRNSKRLILYKSGNKQTPVTVFELFKTVLYYWFYNGIFLSHQWYPIKFSLLIFFSFSLYILLLNLQYNKIYIQSSESYQMATMKFMSENVVWTLKFSYLNNRSVNLFILPLDLGAPRSRPPENFSIRRRVSKSPPHTHTYNKLNNKKACKLYDIGIARDSS